MRRPQNASLHQCLYIGALLNWNALSACLKNTLRCPWCRCQFKWIDLAYSLWGRWFDSGIEKLHMHIIGLWLLGCFPYWRGLFTRGSSSTIKLKSCQCLIWYCRVCRYLWNNGLKLHKQSHWIFTRTTIRQTQSAMQFYKHNNRIKLILLIIVNPIVWKTHTIIFRFHGEAFKRCVARLAKQPPTIRPVGFSTARMIKYHCFFYPLNVFNQLFLIEYFIFQ